MRIAFTHNLQLSDREEEAEFDRPETIQALAGALTGLGHEVELVEVSGPASRTVARLEALAPDLVFNTAKGRTGRFREAFYPALFDRLGLPFTGSDAYTCGLTLDQQITTRYLASHGVLTEEHVAGRDISVCFLDRGPKVTPILEPALSGREHEQVVELSHRIVKTLALKDFARMELRVGRDGRAQLLRVDARPSLQTGSPFSRAGEAAGLGVSEVLEAIVASAAERHGLTPAVLRSKAEKKKRLRVGLTFNLKRVPSSPGGEIDSDAEYDSPKVIAAVKGAIESHGYEVVELEATPELPAIIGAAGVDLVFNMAEGIRGRNREAQVPALLELLDIPYSGSDAATMSLALDKGLAKRLVSQAGIATAPFAVMTTGKEPLPKDFTFPAIVKPVAEGSSKGVLKTSVVESEAELRELVKTIAGKYKQGALVETFLSGREFTVALLGEKEPRVLPPMEIVFINPESKRPVYAFDHKLDWSAELRYDRPAQVDEPLLRELERVARESFDALGCRDVARVDIRLDERGRPNFLEVNPLPGLTPGWSDLCLIAESSGMDYRTLIGEILAPALRRLGEQRGEVAARPFSS